MSQLDMHTSVAQLVIIVVFVRKVLNEMKFCPDCVDFSNGTLLKAQVYKWHKLSCKDQKEVSNLTHVWSHPRTSIMLQKILHIQDLFNVINK